MAQIYALLQPDGSLLSARRKSKGWAVSNSAPGVEGRGKNLTVFLNGLDVLGLTATIPARNENEARRAAPYAIEDEIAETVETSHVALSAADKANLAAPRQINVASTDALTEIVSHLGELGLADAAIVAAHSLLPARDGLYEGPGIILGRLGDRSFAVDASLGRDVLVSLLEPFPDAEIHGEHVAQAVGRSSASNGANSLEAFLVQLATWAENGAAGIDLRQGSFRVRQSVDFDGFGHWRLAGALAAVAAIGWFGTAIVETSAMQSRASGYQELSQEFARVGWPETNGDVQQVLALAGSERGNAGQVFPSVLDATAVLYDSLAQVEGSELRSVRYDRLRRQMTVTVAFDSFADVDRLTTIVTESGLSARSGDSRQSGSKVIGDLTLESGA
ncbi:MAG: type II secretion system protein GspL [Pseudomonadota bacterium]